MFSKLSRYRQVPDVTVLDKRGRLVASKDLRPLPEVTGTFRHTVNADDRLDHLAFKYYSQPLQWWHINDANPQILSPLDLLGKPIAATLIFPLTIATGSPLASNLVRGLLGITGVEDVEILEEVELVFRTLPKGAPNDAPMLFDEVYHRAVQVTFNRANVTQEMLSDEIKAVGFEPNVPVDVSQLGQEIVIPPRPVG